MGRIRVSYPRVRRLLVPLDFSGKSRQALRYALPLAVKFAARIVLLHVLPARDAGKSGPELRLEAERRLARMSAQLVPPQLHGANLVLTGKPAAQILAAVAKHDIDLIVLTTKGETGLKRMLLGGTAEHVMRHARCPVLSVRRT